MSGMIGGGMALAAALMGNKGSSSTSGSGTSSGTSSASGTSTNQVTPWSGTEKGVIGNLGQYSPNYMNPTTSGALKSLGSLYAGGMKPTKKQQSGLASIRNSSLAADQQGLNFSMFGPGGWMNQINNSMADRGMTNSSVDTMAQTGAVENAQNLMNQDVQGANQQYQTGMLDLPFQNANMLSGLASLGLNVSGQNAGAMQSLLNILNTHNMANTTSSSNQKAANQSSHTAQSNTQSSSTPTLFGIPL